MNTGRLPCETCNGSSCRSYFVVITPLDAVNIADYLDINFDDFLTRREKTADDKYYFQLEDGLKYELGLKTPENLECVFLLKIYGQYRCGIHQARPYVCRNYPFTFDEKSDQLKLLDNILCQTEWHLTETQKTEFKNNILKNKDRWKKTYEIYDFWNQSASGKSWPSFLKYLTMFSQKRVFFNWE